MENQIKQTKTAPSENDQSKVERNDSGQIKNESQSKTAADLTALLCVFSRAYHLKTQKNPVFSDFFAQKMLSGGEYAAIKNYLLSGAKLL